MVAAWQALLSSDNSYIYYFMYLGHYTNTCCSHPLHTPNELEEIQAKGVKRAVLRKLEHELGVGSDQVRVGVYWYLYNVVILRKLEHELGSGLIR